jgi:diguanylate cyclase (GGDEF)-like protein
VTPEELRPVRFEPSRGRSKRRRDPRPVAEAVNDPARLAALRDTGLLDTDAEAVFDRLTAVAREALGTDVSLLSLVDADRQFFKSAQGLAQPWAEARETPLSHSFCQRVVATGDALVVEDSRTDPDLADNLAVRDLSIIAYAGVPLTLSDGHTVGSFCAISGRPRAWTAGDLRILTALGEAAVNEIELRRMRREQDLLDPLTGLPNATLFRHHLGLAIEQTRGKRCGVVVLSVGVDDFTSVNESFGHLVGDSLLRSLAQRLRGAVSHEDVLCRFSGDQFLLMCRDIRDEGAAGGLARRLVSTVTEQPFEIDSTRHRVSVSVGIAASGRFGATVDDLIAGADSSMRGAKRSATTVALPESGHRQKAARRLELRNALADALRHEQIDIARQPIVDLDTGAVTGTEVLARWTDRQFGKVSPAEFIALAERSGEIVVLGEQILRRACQQVADWQQSLGRPVEVSVNLAPQQVQQANLVEVVTDILRETGLPASSLTLEVTEGVLLDDRPLHRHTLQGLSDAGVRLALDDFGVGYSALGYLRHFPMDKLKIDRSFIAAMAREPRSRQLVTAIISMARALELTVTAEGIESGEQVALLRELRCQRGQGFFLARPATADETFALISRWSDRGTSAD